MIPVAKGSPYYPVDATENQRPHSMPQQQRISSNDDSWDPLQSPFFSPPGPSTSDFSMDLPSTSSSSSSTSAATPAVHRPEELSPEEEHKKDLDELLGKIDSTIANSRRFVAKSQDSRDYADVEGADFTDASGGAQMDYDGAYQNATVGHNRNASGSSFHTSDDLSGLITNSRQVKNSLKRLEHTQDEFFEL